MSYEEEAKLEAKISDAEDEYKDIKLIRDKIWDEEILETLKITRDEMNLTIAFQDIGKNGKFIKEGQVDDGVNEVVALLSKAIRVFERRKHYWQFCAEEKLNEIRDIIPKFHIMEIAGEYVEGLADYEYESTY